MNHFAAFAASAVLLAGALAACSPPPPPELTKGEVYATYLDRLKAKRAAVLDSVEIEDGKHFADGVAPGAPAPFVNANTSAPADSNVAFLPSERFLNKVEPVVSLDLRSPLIDALDLLDQRATLYRGDPAGDDFAGMMEAALSTRYVAFYKGMEYVEPKIVDTNAFDPGKLTVFVAIMDLDDKRTVASCNVWSTGKQNFGYTYREGSPADAQATLRWTLMDQLRSGILEQLGKCLAERTGATFNLKS